VLWNLLIIILLTNYFEENIEAMLLNPPTDQTDNGLSILS